MFANMNIPKGSLKIIDEKVRKVINQFVKGQCIQKNFIYDSGKNGSLGVPSMKDEYAAYKVNHITNLMSITDEPKILDGYLNMKRKVAKHQSLIDSLEEVLNHLGTKWLDWKDFVKERRKFEWTANEKTNKKQFKFEDKTTGILVKDNLKNIHRSLVNQARIGYDYENYSRFNTRGLINCMETGISNYYLKECKASLADGVTRFIIKSRAGIQFTS
jgi:hypothetical protein